MFTGYRSLMAAVPLALTLGLAQADDIPVETSSLGASTITLHVYPFLTAQELATLRLVATNEQALSLFVPGELGFAALGVSPEDGFIRDSAPVASAVAVSDLPDAEAARAAALTTCDAARKGTAPCVPVLEIAPTP